MTTSTVFVELANEDIRVWRPVQAHTDDGDV
jgi:hypothetical protein